MDDLVSLLARPEPGPAQPVGYRQGVIISYNQTTGANQVLVGGTTVTDLPLLNTSEALLLTPGAVVGILTAGPSWFIIGRVTVPGSEQALSALRMVSDRMLADEVPGQGTRAQATFGDLNDQVGPSVTATISRSGMALVLVGATITTAGAIYSGGLMGFDITGATTRGASVADSLEFSMSSEAFSASATRSILVTGLNAGEHTFTARYRSAASGTPFTCENRNLVVFAL